MDAFRLPSERLPHLRHMLLLDKVCDHFEEVWRSGQRPSIEDICREVPEAGRPDLVWELVAIEVELRLGAGEPAAPDEYQARFPDLADHISRIFDDALDSPRLVLPPKTTDATAESRTKPRTSYNLLLGLVALQNNFIDRDTLLTAFNAWVADKDRAIGQLLVERGVLDRDRHAVLEALVQVHLKQHGDDSQQSLAALSSIGSMREDLERLADPDLTASVAQVSAARRMSDPDATSTRDASPTLRGDRYRIQRPFDAKGNLGELFVAHDLELHREVLLKQVKDAHADRDESRARFVQEAEITGNLEHPGIVPVYGLGKYANGRPFYAMRRIQGQSLKDVIADFHKTDWDEAGPGERTLALQKLLRRFVDVCNTIAYAHSRGVLHRDLKPANIMLGPYGETIVIDWGLAKAVGHHFEAGTTSADGSYHLPSASASPETAIGSVIGTPQFMSPEQAAGQGDRVGPASDVYSLGATFFVLLTGSAPFQGTISEVLDNVQRGEFPNPRRIKRDVPRALEAVCLKAMALHPEGRYASPAELAREIEHWMADEPVTARREALGERFARWARHHKPLITGAVVASLLVPTALAAITIIWSQLNLAEREKLTQQYYNLIEPPPETARTPGWTWDRFAKLEVAASLNVTRDPARLRSEVADCLSTIDVREADPSHRPAMAMAHDAYCLAFSPDGRYLALGQSKTTLSAPCEVRIVDLNSGLARTVEFRPEVTLSAAFRRDIHDGSRAIVFSPRGDGLVVGTRYGWVHRWDLSSPETRPTASWHAHVDRVTDLVFSPDARWLYTGSQDRTITRWDLAADGLGTSPPAKSVRFEREVYALKSTPGVGWLACVTDGRIELIDAETLQRRLGPFPHRGIDGLAVAPDGRMLASSVPVGGSSTGFRIVLLELEHGEEIRSLQDPSLFPGESHADGSLDLEFHPDGSLLASASETDRDHTVKLWEIASGRLLTTLSVGGGAIFDTSFSPDGRFLAITTVGGESVLYELGGFSIQSRIAQQAHPISTVRCAADGRTLACAADQYKSAGQVCGPDVGLWDVATGRRTLRHTTPPRMASDECTDLAFCPAGSPVVSSWTSNRIMVTPTSGDAGSRMIEVDDPIALAFTPDGTRLWAVAGAMVRTWSVPDWGEGPPWSNELAKVFTGRTGLRCLAVGRDWALIGGGDGALRAFPANDGSRPRGGWRCSAVPLCEVALSRDGRAAAVGDQDGVVALFRMPSGQPLSRLRAHRDSVEGIVFSPDGRLLVTGSKDRTIQLWSVADGTMRALLTLRSPTGAVRSVAFTPDGKNLLTVTRGETAVRIWHLDRLRESLKPLGLDWE